MSELIRQSDQIVRAAGQSLAAQRAGGRRLGGRGRSIGRGSRHLKLRHYLRKARNIVLGVFAVFLGGAILGAVVDGIGPLGLLATLMLAFMVAIVLALFPSLKTPTRADLNTDNVQQLVGRTELWLESQRAALPPPAARMVNAIGLQLDELQMQLQQVDQLHPAAVQIRKLVGEDLPEMIEGYQRIPASLRYEAHSGSNPTKQLEEGLGVIGREIDHITRQLAQGSLDDLAIRTRYLDYKYGEAAVESPKEN